MRLPNGRVGRNYVSWPLRISLNFIFESIWAGSGLVGRGCCVAGNQAAGEKRRNIKERIYMQNRNCGTACGARYFFCQVDLPQQQQPQQIRRMEKIENH